jgi:hypothetical protein
MQFQKVSTFYMNLYKLAKVIDCLSDLYHNDYAFFIPANASFWGNFNSRFGPEEKFSIRFSLFPDSKCESLESLKVRIRWGLI